MKITDFGISHAIGDVTLTQTGQITGTPAFLAPEVAQGYEMGEASDVFSLGATLYTCLEGQPPFGMEDNALAMLHRVAGGLDPPAGPGRLPHRAADADAGRRPGGPARRWREVRDELARLAAGRGRRHRRPCCWPAPTSARRAGRPRTTAFPAGGRPAAGAAAAAVAGAAARHPSPRRRAAAAPRPPPAAGRRPGRPRRRCPAPAARLRAAASGGAAAPAMAAAGRAALVLLLLVGGGGHLAGAR